MLTGTNWVLTILARDCIVRFGIEVDFMPFCPDCGTQTSEDMRFCPECGHQVVLRKNGRGVTKRRVAGITVGSVLGVILIAALAAQFSSPDTAPLPPPEPGWVRLQIPDVGSIDYPPDFLELQSANHRELAEALYTIYEVPSPSFVLRQAGLNELEPSALEQYRSVLLSTSYLNRWEVVFRANEEYTLTDRERAEFLDELTSQATEQQAKLTSGGLVEARITDPGSLEVAEVNGMFPLIWTYRRQLDNNPEVLVRAYIFFNYDRIHTLTFAHRVEDAEECADIFAEILASFRLQ